MNKTSIEAVDHPLTISPADVIRPLSNALETESVSINYFELETGESFGYAYHRHPDQEEVFVVLRGTATFDTEGGTVEVSSGEVVRFEPGEFQLGRNRGTERVVALAIGAPPKTNAIEYKIECAFCEEERIHTPKIDEDSGAVMICCSRCGCRNDRVVPSR